MDAGQCHVLPPEGREVPQVLVGDLDASVPELFDGPLDVNGVFHSAMTATSETLELEAL